MTTEKLSKDLQQQVSTDLTRKMETTAFQVLEDLEKKQKSEEEEKAKQIIPESLLMAAARDASALTTNDPMDEMPEDNVKSSEGLAGGISKVFSAIKVDKRKTLVPAFSRDDTPPSRDSRGQSTNKKKKDEHAQNDQETYNRLIAIPLFNSDVVVKKEAVDIVDKQEVADVTIPIEATPPFVEVMMDPEYVKPTPKSSVGHPNELSSGENYLDSGEERREGSNGRYEKELRVYKTVYDPSIMTTLETKHFVRRFHGKCNEKFKQFDYPHEPKDPRVQYRKIEQPENLKVAKLTVDDQYIGIPPKREVTIYNLNDNVNEKILRDMANKQKLSPEEVIVYYHPRNRKHLTIALILFKNSKEARLFVEKNNGKSLMGMHLSCTLDSFAAELSTMYTYMVGEPLPTLKHLSGMSEQELERRREKMQGFSKDTVEERMWRAGFWPIRSYWKNGRREKQ